MNRPSAEANNLQQHLDRYMNMFLHGKMIPLESSLMSRMSMFLDNLFRLDQTKDYDLDDPNTDEKLRSLYPSIPMDDPSSNTPIDEDLFSIPIDDDPSSSTPIYEDLFNTPIDEDASFNTLPEIVSSMFSTIEFLYWVEKMGGIDKMYDTFSQTTSDVPELKQHVIFSRFDRLHKIKSTKFSTLNEFLQWVDSMGGPDKLYELYYEKNQ